MHINEVLVQGTFRRVIAGKSRGDSVEVNLCVPQGQTSLFAYGDLEGYHSLHREELMKRVCIALLGCSYRRINSLVQYFISQRGRSDLQSSGEKNTDSF